MRMSLWTAALAVVTTCAPAMAADLMVAPAPEMPMPMASSYDWTGPYVGGSVGVLDATSDVGSILFDGVDSGLDPYSIDASGWLAGVTIGVNQQWDNIVVGIEGDLSWSNAEGTHEDLDANYSITTRLQALATLRGRVGFALDNVLLYGTAGLAYGSIEAQLDDVYGAAVVTTTDTQGQFGWTAGLGAEMGVSDTITLKAEALYYDLGDATYEFSEPSPPGYDSITADTSTNGWLGRVGLNFRF